MPLAQMDRRRGEVPLSTFFLFKWVWFRNRLSFQPFRIRCNRFPVRTSRSGPFLNGPHGLSSGPAKLSIFNHFSITKADAWNIISYNNLTTLGNPFVRPTPGYYLDINPVRKPIRTSVDFWAPTVPKHNFYFHVWWPCRCEFGSHCAYTIR